MVYYITGKKGINLKKPVKNAPEETRTESGSAVQITVGPDA